MQSMVDQTNVSMVDRANIPGGPSSPQVMKNLALGLLGGLLLGIGLAVVLEISIRRVHSLEDLTAELGVPLLRSFEESLDSSQINSYEDKNVNGFSEQGNS